MNGERKLNDASEIAKAKETGDESLKTATNGTVRHVPVPTIHCIPMDPNVCQGLGQKLDYQGKIIMIHTCFNDTCNLHVSFVDTCA